MSINRFDTKPLVLPGGETYAESRGEKPFDWNAFLQRAILTPPEDEEHLTVRELASDWVTCACGNQCAIIPRLPNSNAPSDERLIQLGLEFMDLIDIAEWQRAKTTLAAIERRSAELIAQLRP